INACSPDEELPETCNANTIERARQRYVYDPNPDCIYAGNISGYPGGQKQAFGCIPPTKFCFGSSTCKGEGTTAAYSCSDGQVICNPMIFGLQADGETPFCIDRQQNATLMCDQISSGQETSRHPFLSSASEPTGWRQTSGIREAWNEFSDRLFQMCHTN